MKEKKNMNSFYRFWLTQAASQLGSAMTSYALIIWAYTKTQSAMAVSLMTFCNFLPYVAVSIFAGDFIDRHSKKKVMLVSDTLAAVCSLFVLFTFAAGNLEIWHIYIVNAIIGFMNAYQSPAQSVAVGILVPTDKISKASGMSSFSGNLVMVFSPVLGAALLSLGGLELVLAIDLGSFLLAFAVLAFFIKIPEEIQQKEKSKAFDGFFGGVAFLKENRGIFYIMLTMSLLNFFSRLTYENILSPMLLARSGNMNAMGIVNGILGVGGIIGGFLVSLIPEGKKPVKMIYYSAMLSFVFGDILMGLGRNVFWWGIAGVAASLPIPFINAGQNVILYRTIPVELQGRVFSVRNAIQYCTIPIAILFGGFLADYVFEPFMQGKTALALSLQRLVGNGAGSGMAVMFLCTGVLGFLASIFGYTRKEIRRLETEEERENI